MTAPGIPGILSKIQQDGCCIAGVFDPKVSKNDLLGFDFVLRKSDHRHPQTSFGNTDVYRFKDVSIG